MYDRDPYCSVIANSAGWSLISNTALSRCKVSVVFLLSPHAYGLRVMLTGTSLLFDELVHG